ncbi:MAG: polysaccharide export protein [Candidatus Hydrogenedentes bacterium]|nr:polysaccharide export protein [Candidatus Hydrogenedentota bacterium]
MGQVDPDGAGSVVKERIVVNTKSLYEFPDREALDAAAQPAPAPTESGSFKIGEGDILHLELFDDTTLNREVAVRYDGYVSLPLINELHVAGQTPADAEAMVRDAYKSVFRQPRVSLTVVEPESKSFFVLGDVAQPKEYPYKRPINLLQAINTAGGLRVDNQNTDSTIGAQGQLTKAFIIREVGGRRDVLAYDLTGLSHPGEHPSQAPVLPGDIVYIPEGVNLVYVLGEILAPRVYPLIEGMTLLELVARAGGPVEETARMRSIVLFRKLEGGQTEAMLIDLRRALQTGYSPTLEPGDIVYIPRNPLVRLHDNLMHFTRLTETVSPLLGLYMQAYDTYYTRERYDRLFENNSLTGLGVIQTLIDLLP